MKLDFYPGVAMESERVNRVARSTAQKYGEQHVKLYFGMMTTTGIIVTAGAAIAGAASVILCTVVRRQSSKMCYACASATSDD